MEEARSVNVLSVLDFIKEIEILKALRNSGVGIQRRFLAVQDSRVVIR